MNELCMYAVLAFYALQPTSSFSMAKQPLQIFGYQNDRKLLSVIALGMPDEQKTRNKNQIFIMGERNPFFAKIAKNKLSIAGVATVVLVSDTYVEHAEVEKRIQDYDLQISFSEKPVIISCSLPGHSTYTELQDAQLQARRKYQRAGPCRKMESKL